MSISKSRSYRMVVNQTEEPPPEEVGNVIPRRAKPVGGGVSLRRGRPAHKSARCISCADLGGGSHQGWLRTRKPRKNKWDECHKWCVIKDGDLFVYASQMDTTATSRIHLPMFTVSEAKETKKSGAFKVANAGTTFYFRSRTDEGKYEWINHLSLAAIGYKDHVTQSARETNHSSGIGSACSSGISHPYSDSDETDSSCISEEAPAVLIRAKRPSRSIYPSKRLQSRIEDNKDLRRMITSIREADLDMMGADSAARRQSQMRKSLVQAGFTRTNSSKNKRIFTLRAKERQKQALEQELADINKVIDSPSRKNLHDFLSHYPDYEDSANLDNYYSGEETTTGSARSSDDLDLRLTSIDSHRTLVAEGANRRGTIIADQDLLMLPGIDNLHVRDSSSNRNSKDPVFSKQKHKQIVTSL